MRFPHMSRMCIVAALAAMGTNFGMHHLFAAQPGPADAQEGVEVLTRGPVHEAFAETVTFNPEPGIVIPQRPPADIEELPPEQRPEGENVAWIPGYWGWDDERNDFLWVSGIWRALPPGRQWVPGYWSDSGQVIQWTSGYWADAQVSEVEYLPQPPQTVEAGPNIAAPAADQSWMPGCWVWHQSRYAWRPGYWATVQPNWVWVPAHYVWAPRGYVFVDGYWDYSVVRRGVLFAPVYFNASVYTRPGFYYSPAMVINPAVFASQLFLRPRYQHYYFGDYYAASYANAGFYSWFSYHNRQGYDPIYAHQHWQHRQDREWERNLQADFQYRRDHEEARPPRTFAAQQALGRSGAEPNEKRIAMAASLDQLAKSNDSPMRFRPLEKQQRQDLAKHGQEVRRFALERQKLDGNVMVGTAEKPVRQSGPTRAKLPTSPIVARSADQPGDDQAPPKRHAVLKPNLQIEPSPRAIGSREPGDDQPNRPTIEPRPTRQPGTPPASKIERKQSPFKTEPKPAPRVEQTPAPRVEQAPAPRKIERRPAPANAEPRPRSIGSREPGDDRPNRSKIEPRPTRQTEVPPALKIERGPAPRAELTPAPRNVERGPMPAKVDRKPQPPRVEQQPAPRVEPKQGTSVGRREPPKGAPRLKPAERKRSAPKAEVEVSPAEPQVEPEEKPKK